MISSLLQYMPDLNELQVDANLNHVYSSRSMGSAYHLTLEERKLIEYYANQYFTQKEIARLLRRSRSVICNELKRCKRGQYNAEWAHEIHLKTRYKSCQQNAYLKADKLHASQNIEYSEIINDDINMLKDHIKMIYQQLNQLEEKLNDSNNSDVNRQI